LFSDLSGFFDFWLLIFFVEGVGSSVSAEEITSSIHSTGIMFKDFVICSGTS
jgi:hypothetical protein